MNPNPRAALAYEDVHPYAFVVSDSENGEIAAFGFLDRGGAETQRAGRVALREARFVDLRNPSRDSIRIVRKLLANRPLERTHDNGFGSMDFYVEGNLFVLEPPLASWTTFYRPLYVVDVAADLAERLRAPEHRRQVTP